MLQVTIDMYSGLPNPTWLIENESDAKRLLQEIAEDRGATAAVQDGPGHLGYRGLIVEIQRDNLADKFALSSEFRIGHNSHAKGLDISRRLLGTMAEGRVLEDTLYRGLIEQLEHLAAGDDETEPDGGAVTAAPGIAEAARVGVTCYIELGAFNPGFWNGPAYIGRNNCYNYASNRRTNTFAQPGRATGHQAKVMACNDVTAAALSDGLHHRYDCFPDSEKPRWLMALVVAPGYDYHWYRKQKEGFWGHKPGGTAARNTDNNGAVVMNPETCARLPYTNFCGYFYACKSQKIS
jgi:hypothetical protein